MTKEKNDFVVCARLHGGDAFSADETNALAGEPILRRLNRIERISLSFNGKVVRRVNNGMLIVFDTADHAVLAACEIQRRCVDMPQLSGTNIHLVIGIHKASSDSEKKETTIVTSPGADRRNARRRFGFDTAGRLAASTDEDAIIISSLIYSLLEQPLRDISSLLLDSKVGRAYSIDWKAPIDWQNSSQIARVMTLSPSKKLLLQQGAKYFELDQLYSIATIGRDPGCDFMIRGSYVSRIHAQIEIREEGCVLTDQSVNGTSIRPLGSDELLVKGSSHILSGSGQLFFGNPAEKHVSNTIVYSVLETSGT